MRKRNGRDVANEVAELLNGYRLDALFFADLSFNADPAHVRSICRELVAAGIHVPWYCMCCMDNLTPDILTLMAKAGCRKIGIGVESPVMGERVRIKSGYVATDGELLKAISCAHELGILVKGYFMIGYPWDTEESLREFDESLYRFHFDEIKVSFFTPFPGTRAYSDYKHLLATDDWRLYDTVSQPIVRNSTIPAARLVAWRKECFRRYYSSATYKHRVHDTCERLPELEQSYIDFADQIGAALSLPNFSFVE